MLSHGGMSAVRVVLVTDATNKPQQEVPGRWEGISSLNNFLYQEDCVTVWKACNIGEGKNIPWSQLQVPVRLPDVCKAEVSKGDFVACSKERRVPAERAMIEHLDEEKDEDGDEEEEGASSGLLSCPVDGCICTYQKYYNLERHLLFGKCKLVSEKHTLFDQAVLAYAKKI
ncbi:uncharacterized protein LOC144666618 [Oculina patagonica]